MQNYVSAGITSSLNFPLPIQSVKKGKIDNNRVKNGMEE